MVNTKYGIGIKILSVLSWYIFYFSLANLYINIGIGILLEHYNYIHD